jgi:hypothetical protein
MSDTRPASTSSILSFTVPADEFRNLPVPGVSFPAKLGTCFARVTDIPAELGDYMAVNPRVPRRSTKNILSGPVPKAILATLRENPADMAFKNAGIYLLVDSVEHFREKGGTGMLRITLTDQNQHGIVNGGHTFAAIREAIEGADPEELKQLQQAYVRLHLLQGVPDDMVPEIAEGLNRSKQVQDPSLENLRGHFDDIKDVMKGHLGEKAIAYHEGAEGDVYIGEVLSFIEIFNLERYQKDEHPYGLYAHQSRAVKEFADDYEMSPSAVKLVITRLPEILELTDMIRRDVPPVAKSKVNFEIGRMKIGEGKKGRVAGNGDSELPFLAERTRYRLPNGWLFPILSSFRANVIWNLKKGQFDWRVSNAEVLRDCLPDLVSVCVNEHRNNNQKPEWVGKRDSAYRQCQLHVELYLAKKGKLS